MTKIPFYESIIGTLLNIFIAVLSLIPGYTTLREGDEPYGVCYTNPKFLHIYVAKKVEPRNVVIFVHGGGWVCGSIDQDNFWTFNCAFIGHALASRGITTALVSYPLCSIAPYKRNTVFGLLAMFCVVLAYVLSCVLCSFWFWMVLALPCYAVTVVLLFQRMFSRMQVPGTSIADQVETVDWMIGKVRDLYPNARITLVGHSAGAHLVAVYALSSLKFTGAALHAVVCLSGVYDFPTLARSFVVRTLLLDSIFVGKAEGALAAYSPLQQLCHHNVPIGATPKWYIMTAYGDNPELCKQADEFHMELLKNCRPSMRVQSVGNGHGVGMLASESAWNLVSVIAGMPCNKTF